jgi:lysophospholipase L1-like esterase
MNLKSNTSFRLLLQHSSIIWLIFFVLSFSYSQQVPLYLQNKNYSLQLEMYDIFTTQQKDVVMLGNSLTFHANWNEILNRTNIANRGIVSDVTNGYLHRLQYVLKLHPKLCFIEGGVNDIYANVPVTEVFHNITQIIDSLRNHNIIPILQSAILVGIKWHEAVDKNKQISNLDSLLSEYAQKHLIEFINLNPLLTHNSLLKDELTADGVHLNALGYALWAPEIEKVLVKYHL